MAINWSEARKEAVKLEKFFSAVSGATELFDKAAKAESALGQINLDLETAEDELLVSRDTVITAKAKAAKEIVVVSVAHDAKLEELVNVRNLAVARNAELDADTLKIRNDLSREASIKIYKLKVEIAVQTENRDNLEKEIAQLTEVKQEVESDLSQLRERIS